MQEWGAFSSAALLTGMARCKAPGCRGSWFLGLDIPWNPCRHQRAPCPLSSSSHPPFSLPLPYLFPGTPQLPLPLSVLHATRSSHPATGENQKRPRKDFSRSLRASGCIPRGSPREAVFGPAQKVSPTVLPPLARGCRHRSHK